MHQGQNQTNALQKHHLQGNACDSAIFNFTILAAMREYFIIKDILDFIQMRYNVSYPRQIDVTLPISDSDSSMIISGVSSPRATVSVFGYQIYSYDVTEIGKKCGLGQNLTNATVGRTR